MAVLIAGLALTGSAMADSVPSPPPSPDPDALYRQHCLSCHQADGGGVPMLQPPLIGSGVLAGPAEPLIRLLLFGASDPSAEWGNEMAGYAMLSDAEIAALLTDLRQRFVIASPISEQAVAKLRDQGREAVLP